MYPASSDLSSGNGKVSKINGNHRTGARINTTQSRPYAGVWIDGREILLFE